VVADFRRVTPDLQPAEDLLDSRDALGAAVRVGAVLATDPDHVPALLLMARAQIALSHPGTAVELAERACELAPADPAALNVLSLALTGGGRHDEAVTAARQAVRADPREAAQHDRLARALLGARRFTEAEQAAETAVTLEPGVPGILLTLAAAHAGLDHRDRARRVLFAVLEIDPQHVEARAQLVKLAVPARRNVRRPAVAPGRLVVPALALGLVGLVLLLQGFTAPAVACLGLAVVFLLAGGFRGNHSEQA
jgi:cytochrome c-type biogenesis protein CcmH/NrfG